MRTGGGGILVDELEGIPWHYTGLWRGPFDGQLLLKQSRHVWMVMEVVVEGDRHACAHVLRLERQVVVCGDVRARGVEQNALDI